MSTEPGIAGARLGVVLDDASMVFKGGGLFQFPTPPPSGPPKVLEPAFLQIEILGKTGGTAGTENFFCGLAACSRIP